MYSSRMRTVRCSGYLGRGVYPFMHWAGECLPRGVCQGVSAQGMSTHGGCLRGGVCLRGCVPRGCLPGRSVCPGVSARGWLPGGVCPGECVWTVKTSNLQEPASIVRSNLLNKQVKSFCDYYNITVSVLPLSVISA